MIVDDKLLDRIYEAAVIPSEWPNLLEILSSNLDAAGGVLFTDTPRYSESVSSASMLPLRTAFEEAGWGQKNARIARVLQRGLFGFTITDQDLFTPKEVDASPMYSFLRGIGGGWCIGFALQVPTGDSLAISFEGAHARGPFDAAQVAYVEGVRPHVSRSALLTARLGLHQARAAAEAMGLIGLPTAVISRSSRLLTCNKLFEAYMPSLVLDGRERIVLTDTGADLLLARALQQLDTTSRGGAILSIPVRAAASRDALVFHVVPIRRAANDIFLGASCLLVATPVGRKATVSAGLLQGLFDLTAAEARIARGVGAGESLNDLAAQNGLSVGTVRNQLKAVFAKTGLARQSDLVAMLGSIGLQR